MDRSQLGVATTIDTRTFEYLCHDEKGRHLHPKFQHNALRYGHNRFVVGMHCEHSSPPSVFGETTNTRRSSTWLGQIIVANCGKANERVFFCEYYSSVLPSGIHADSLKEGFVNLPAQIQQHRKIVGHPFLRSQCRLLITNQIML